MNALADWLGIFLIVVVGIVVAIYYGVSAL